eukprot:GHVN01059386.1.p5 GENE.GHVN01059386.1~~GHVN01059386.1.p5  ORF type:complete len:301 (+),score=43.11 GHVN01059386.1:5693-6595(+)
MQPERGHEPSQPSDVSQPLVLPHHQRQQEQNDTAFKQWVIAQGMCFYLVVFMCGFVLGLVFFASSVVHIASSSQLATPSTVPKPFGPVRFEDIGGMEETKEELQEIVECLRDPERIRKLGAKIPKGVLLVGPPGSGKTLLARAVATEASVQFFYVSGSEFVELYVGQGARRVRDLFNEARLHAPCIVFIDEIDTMGAVRSKDHSGGGSREHDQTLNQMLVEMDGFSNSRGIVVMGATNRQDILDPALLRSGRFDRVIQVPLPDLAGRVKILTYYLARTTNNVTEHEVRIIAKATPGFSGQ